MYVQEFQNYVRGKYGIHFDLGPLKDGTVSLEGIQVPKDAPRGTGTAAMEDLVAWADKNGIMLTLSLGEKGYSPQEKWKKTSSQARLTKFYRRFGFVPNKGRYKRYHLSIYVSMYRDPKGGAVMEERIVQAAFIDPKTNTVYPVGSKHTLKALLAHRVPEEIIQRIVDEPNQGFVTNAGRWLSREAAALFALDKRGEMDSAEIKKAHEFDLHKPITSHLAWDL